MNDYGMWLILMFRYAYRDDANTLIFPEAVDTSSLYGDHSLCFRLSNRNNHHPPRCVTRKESRGTEEANPRNADEDVVPPRGCSAPYDGLEVARLEISGERQVGFIRVG